MTLTQFLVRKFTKNVFLRVAMAIRILSDTFGYSSKPMTSWGGAQPTAHARMRLECTKGHDASAFLARKRVKNLAYESKRIHEESDDDGEVQAWWTGACLACHQVSNKMHYERQKVKKQRVQRVDAVSPGGGAPDAASRVMNAFSKNVQAVLDETVRKVQELAASAIVDMKTLLASDEGISTPAVSVPGEDGDASSEDVDASSEDGDASGEDGDASESEPIEMVDVDDEEKPQSSLMRKEEVMRDTCTQLKASEEKVAGDGNCLFHSLTAALCVWIRVDNKNIRAALVGHVERTVGENPDEAMQKAFGTAITPAKGVGLKTLGKDPTQVPWAEALSLYKRLMGKDSDKEKEAWGSHREIRFLAQALGVAVVVVDTEYTHASVYSATVPWDFAAADKPANATKACMGLLAGTEITQWVLDKEKGALTGEAFVRGGRHVLYSVIVRTVSLTSIEARRAMDTAGGKNDMKGVLKGQQGRARLPHSDLIIPALVIVSRGTHFDPIIPKKGHCIVAERVSPEAAVAPQPGMRTRAGAYKASLTSRLTGKRRGL